MNNPSSSTDPTPHRGPAPRIPNSRPRGSSLPLRSASYSSRPGAPKWRAAPPTDLDIMTRTLRQLDEGGRDLPLARRPEIPLASSFKPNPFLTRNHPCRDILERDHPLLSSADLVRLSALYGGKPCSITGIGNALPASPRRTHPDATKDYGAHQWLRDAFYDWLALALMGKWDKILPNLLDQAVLIAGPGQRDKFYSLSQPDMLAHWRYNAANDPNEWPPIRTIIGESGDIALEKVLSDGRVHSAMRWGNNQPHSFAMLLWFLTHVASEYDGCPFSDLGKLNADLSAQLRKRFPGVGDSYAAHNDQHSIFALLFEFLETITRNPVTGKFELKSLGVWEEYPLTNRLTDLIPIRAAAHCGWKYFERTGWNGLPIANSDRLKRSLEWLIVGPEALINELVPRHSSAGVAAEAIVETVEGDRITRRRVLDSSTIFCAWPFLESDSGICDEQSDAMFAAMCLLMKPDDYQGFGVPRYFGDQFCHAGMNRFPDANYNVPKEHMWPGGECHWFLQDPVAAAWCARKAERKFREGANRAGLELAITACNLAKRSWSQIPTIADSYKLQLPDGRKEIIKVRPGSPHEGITFMYDHEGKLVPRFTPQELNWTAALRICCTARIKRLEVPVQQALAEVEAPRF